MIQITFWELDLYFCKKCLTVSISKIRKDMARCVECGKTFLRTNGVWKELIIIEDLDIKSLYPSKLY